VKFLGPVLSAAAFIVFVVLYGCLYLFIFTGAGFSIWINTAIFLIMAGFTAAMVWTVYTRINELKKGEEDDLGKY